MNGWCVKCNGVERADHHELIPVRETKPHYQYRFDWMPVCEDGHVLANLCEGCGERPSAEGIDYCHICWPEDAEEPTCLEYRIAKAEITHDFKRDQVLEIADLARKPA